ncbi:unnamed protein product [Cyprideis torosa]|uniref:Uncharacterized protein n=1 Tax=Cyprideis torosa TaxID=163714 RepID=A0A7R8W716_9CRUS|nr:unnamed protein product [Cyprideis torosa]CAG0881931.1 unnamed protein product [Cyprideis torosa]
MELVTRGIILVILCWTTTLNSSPHQLRDESNFEISGPPSADDVMRKDGSDANDYEKQQVEQYRQQSEYNPGKEQLIERHPYPYDYHHCHPPCFPPCPPPCPCYPSSPPLLHWHHAQPVLFVCTSRPAPSLMVVVSLILLICVVSCSISYSIFWLHFAPCDDRNDMDCWDVCPRPKKVTFNLYRMLGLGTRKDCYCQQYPYPATFYSGKDEEEGPKIDEVPSDEK